MVQTPVQRRANVKFARDQEAKMGRSSDQVRRRVKETAKSPISPIWMIILGFAIFGSLIFELISRFFFK